MRFVVAGSYIAKTSNIFDHVTFGKNVTIEDFCVVGLPSSSVAISNGLHIPDNSIIRSHSVIYDGSVLGNGFQAGHHSTIRDSVVLGQSVSVGNYTTIDREVTIGDYTRIHSYSHIGRGSKIGEFCWIYSLVTLMNDPLPPSLKLAPVTLENMVTVLVNSQIYPGSILRAGSMITASSTFEGELPAGAFASGNPGEVLGKVKHLRNLEYGIQHPWHKHFIDYYPVDCHSRIREMASEIYER